MTFCSGWTNRGCVKVSVGQATCRDIYTPSSELRSCSRSSTEVLVRYGDWYVDAPLLIASQLIKVQLTSSVDLESISFTVPAAALYCR